MEAERSLAVRGSFYPGQLLPAAGLAAPAAHPVLPEDSYTAKAGDK